MKPDNNSRNPFVMNFGQVDAYLVGLVMADGCIMYANGCYKMQITLGIKDRDIIDKLYAHYKVGSIQTYNQATNYGNIQTIRWTVYDHNLVHGLMYFELEPRKTDLEVVPSLPYEMHPHFIRGFFDGDGSVHCKYSEKHTRNIHKISFALSQHMGQAINSLFHRELDITPKKISLNGKSKVNYALQICGASDLKKIYEYLYKDASIFLDRKQVTFKKLYDGLNAKGEKYHGKVY